MSHQRQSALFQLSADFDLGGLTRAFEAAGWRAGRVARRLRTGLITDTPQREILTAGMAAIEESDGKNQEISVWVVPLSDSFAPTLLLRRPSGTPEELAAALTETAHLRLEGKPAPLERFECRNVSLRLTCDAGSVHALVESMSPAGAPGDAIATLRLEVIKGGADMLALAAGLARLTKGVGGETHDGPSMVLEMLGLKAGPLRAPRVMVFKSMLAGEAAAAILRRHFDNVLANEAGTRAGLDDEFLHDMRVATRRLREALRMFVPVFDKGAAERITAEVKWLAASLGAVRDLDVYIAAVPGYLERAQWEPPEYEFYVQALKAGRDAARRDLLSALESGRYAALKADMAAFIADPPLADSTVLLEVIARRRLASLSRKARKLADAAKSDEELHQARIAFKRLRYAAEFVRDLAPKQLVPLAKAAVACQDVLGRHQDAIVACDRVLAAIEANRDDGLKAFLLGYLLACQRLAAIEARSEFLRHWRREGGSKELASLSRSALAHI